MYVYWMQLIIAGIQTRYPLGICKSLMVCHSSQTNGSYLCTSYLYYWEVIRETDMLCYESLDDGQVGSAPFSSHSILSITSVSEQPRTNNPNSVSIASRYNYSRIIYISDTGCQWLPALNSWIILNCNFQGQMYFIDSLNNFIMTPLQIRKDENDNMYILQLFSVLSTNIHFTFKKDVHLLTFIRICHRLHFPNPRITSQQCHWWMWFFVQCKTCLHFYNSRFPISGQFCDYPGLWCIGFSAYGVSVSRLMVMGNH